MEYIYIPLRNWEIFIRSPEWGQSMMQQQRAVNTLRPTQNGPHFADDIFKRIFLNEKIWIPIKILLKFVPKGSVNNIPALVQIMAWRRPGDKPLNGPMMVRLPTHMCVTRPQWVNGWSLYWSPHQDHSGTRCSNKCYRPVPNGYGGIPMGFHITQQVLI